MSKATTHVLFVTDMSSSMRTLAEDVRGGFNSYLQQLRTNKAETGTRYRITVTLFDDRFITLCVAAKLAAVPELTHTNYTPTGMTALLDAVGKTITQFEAATTLSDDDRVLLVIQTDGGENHSRDFSWGRIRKLLEVRQKTGQWSIVYLGQGIDAWDQGAKFGPSTQVLRSAHTGRSTQSTYTGLATATVAYAAGTAPADVGDVIAATPGVVDPTAPQTPGPRQRTRPTKGAPMGNVTTESPESAEPAEEVSETSEAPAAPAEAAEAEAA